MAGWSLSSSSFSHDVIQIIHKLQSIGFCLDLSISTSDLSPQKLSIYFDRILSIFQTEIQYKEEIRPIPAMLGDGQIVDLFKLYSIVQERGGLDSVTADKGWASVSEVLGFDSRVGSCVKLVYVKYLEALERWLEKVLVKRENLSLGSVGELRAEVNGLFQEVSEPVKEEEVKGTPVSASKKNHFLVPVRDGGRRLKLDDDNDDQKGVGNGIDNDGDVVAIEQVVAKRDSDVVMAKRGSDVVIIEPEMAKRGPGTCNKRKRDALVGILDWVLKVAKNPLDPVVGKVLPSNEGIDKENHLVGRLYSQVLLARQAIFLKKVPMNGDIPNLQRGQGMHPSVYDHINCGTPTEKLRYSGRLHSANKQPNSVSCSETSANPSCKDKSAGGDESNTDKKKPKNSSSLSDIMVRLLPKTYTYERVPVSSHFQAQLPHWTDKSSSNPYNSDHQKWLGTPIWPQNNQKCSQFEQDHIGRGRQDSCRCERPGSIECVRFHIAEKRFKLKHELGSAFHSWKFDCMGEEVALAWTEEEAQKFKAIVHPNPPSEMKNFWDQLQLAFPSKRKKDLVSYYFNVFLIARRGYQNRLTPESIDSDDEEEAEFDFLTVQFGHGMIKAQAPKLNFCFQNAQCVDIDD